ncbi:hypothetical protein Fuma_06361 [Fuerstiella marisgermanici]|uniref:Uncharacterized protein n=2 Tax=Fuerstiella marisgermanici TaxID=1891926 RepID=A0A1P8WRN1_9PLAN|nr:hypothetical protein Fuma_06361 [Fuerstiella marisgermanici]
MAVKMSFSQLSCTVAMTVSVLATSQLAQGQLIRAPLDTGFVRTSSISMTVDELLGSQKTRAEGEPLLGPGYPDLRIAEVQFKPVRYRRMDVTNPQTGERSKELVWYMVYRVIPRDPTELAGDSRDDLVKKLSDPNLLPQNQLEPPTRAPLLLPRFILRTDDAGNQQTYVDEVNLEIQRNVLAREFRNRAENLQLMNSVQAITEVTETVSDSDPDELSKALYGVAVWRNVDPTTDYFTVMMTGFSNAYRVLQNADGSTVVEHKVIVQKFGRPGDEFNQQENEFRLIDKARLKTNGDIVVDTDSGASTYPANRPAPAFVNRLRAQFQEMEAAGELPELSWPMWEYQPRPKANITVPEYDSILRNAKNKVATQPAAQ